MTNKDKFKVKILKEKLEKESGKKVVLKENKSDQTHIFQFIATELAKQVKQRSAEIKVGRVRFVFKIPNTTKGEVEISIGPYFNKYTNEKYSAYINLIGIVRLQNDKNDEDKDWDEWDYEDAASTLSGLVKKMQEYVLYLKSAIIFK